MSVVTFRHFCTASQVLDVYAEPNALRWTRAELITRLKEAVALSLRTEFCGIPDHQHRNRVSQTFGKKNTLANMLLLALGATDESDNSHCLEIDHDCLYVRRGLLEQWQREVVAYQSPLPLMAGEWARHCYRYCRDEAHGLKHIQDALAYSTLPGVNDRHMQTLIRNKDGAQLCDLHVHLSGASEATPVWLFSLHHPDSVIAELHKALKPEKSRANFFLHQLDTNPAKILHRLRAAAAIRSRICELLRAYDAGVKIFRAPLKIFNLLHGFTIYEASFPQHPFRHPAVVGSANEVQREAAMWLHAIWILRSTLSPRLAMLMHVYLLLMNQHLRLLVQHPDQYGFDQFQYITLVGAREAAESPETVGFTERFRQFHGMYGPDLAYMEARFSPKSTPGETARLLTKIWRDYNTAMEGAGNKHPSHSVERWQAGKYKQPRGIALPHRHSQPPGYSLGLVAHFIKKPDNDEAAYRHLAFRDEIFRKAQVLLAVRQSFKQSQAALYAALVGKDAAANELDTPPEVFAPTFRYLTREGITHTTFHAGEDFVHLLCGIRAVHEAITFLELCSGDRIGHATALGLAPELTTGETIRCAGGQWLDNLIWLSRLVYTSPRLAAFKGELTQLQIRITELYMRIYEKNTCPALPVLWKAWELRAYDPRKICGNQVPGLFDSKLEESAILRQKKSTDDRLYMEAAEEIKRYHKNQPQWKAVITVSPEEQPGPTLLRAVQDEIISEMREKNIVVEVLPTSNVRISRYETTQEHHLMRWLDPDDSRPVPQVVIGTDDPGIFSTTLRNEYSFILNKFQTQYPGSSEIPYDLIQHLIENGLSYKFAQDDID